MITQMAYLQHTHINKPKHTIYTDVATLIQKHYFHPYYQSHLQQANGSADSPVWDTPAQRLRVDLWANKT